MPNKALAATGMVIFAGAVSTLIIKTWLPWADAAYSEALTTVIAGMLTFAATYFTPHN